MRAASQLLGRGPLMWMLPPYLHVNKKTDDNDDDDPSNSVIMRLWCTSIWVCFVLLFISSIYYFSLLNAF